jgi:hypothetical protein
VTIEPDRLAQRREAAVGATATRPGAERVRALAAGSIESARVGSGPVPLCFDPEIDPDPEVEADAGVRLSLSPAALRIDPSGTATPSTHVAAAASAPAGSIRADDAGVDSNADADTASSGFPSESTKPAGEGRAPSPRQRLFDAYREHVPAPRGERIRVVV